MKRSWIGCLASLTLGLICAVALSTAPFGCSQNKGGTTQVKSGQSCKMVEGKCAKDCKCGKDCKCAKKAAGKCPKDCPKSCCPKAGGTCPKDCPKAGSKCAKKAAGKCPSSGTKPCGCKKAQGQ